MFDAALDLMCIILYDFIIIITILLCTIFCREPHTASSVVFKIRNHIRSTKSTVARQDSSHGRISDAARLHESRGRISTPPILAHNCLHLRYHGR
jgi:hypothetical protein